MIQEKYLNLITGKSFELHCELASLLCALVMTVNSPILAMTIICMVCFALFLRRYFRVDIRKNFSIVVASYMLTLTCHFLLNQSYLVIPTILIFFLQLHVFMICKARSLIIYKEKIYEGM